VTHGTRHDATIEAHIVDAARTEHPLNSSNASKWEQHECFCGAHAITPVKVLPWFHSRFTAFQRSDAVRVVSG
jgi:hypothetical protein